MKFLVEAVDKGRGMTMHEIEQAFAKARATGCQRLKKTRIGFKDQIKSMEFDDGTNDRVARV